MVTKEYKILSQSISVFAKKDKEFEEILNMEARNGWKLVTVVNNGSALKAFMEKSKQ